MGERNPRNVDVPGFSVTTPLNDFLCYDRENALKYRAEKKELPARGTPHPKSDLYPNHKLCGIVDDPEEGWLRFYYAATRASQQTYNWENAQLLENDFPEVRQTWVIPRADHASNGGIALTAPPSLGGHAWTYMGYKTQRTDEITDGLFIILTHVYFDVTTPLRGEVFDADSGEMTGFQRNIVAAGTAGQVTDNNGTIKEIQPINNLHSWRTTKQAAGLAGQAVNGKAVRTYRYVDNYPWAAVLDYIVIVPVHTDASDIYSPVNRYIVVPIKKAEAYNGPCKVTLIERWTKVKPDFGGDSGWPTTGANPDIPVPTELQQMAIDFNGVELQVNVGACLHSGFTFYDSGLRQTFVPTTPTRWPASLLGRVTLTPDQGGWLMRSYIFDAPSTKGQSSGLDLTLVSTASTSCVVAWTAGAGAPTKLDVATDGSFETGFLAGFNDKTVTSAAPLEATITGMVRGQIYYARVRRNGITSNTLTILAKPLAELQVSQAGQPLLTAATLSLGSVELDGTGTVTLTLANIGLLKLTDFAATITGTDAGMFSVGTLPVSLAPTGTATVDVRFNPTSAGNKTAALSIATNDASSPFVLNLTGIGAAPEIAVEQPAGTNIADGGTVAFGTVTAGTVSKVFKLRNVGTATLRDLALSISGADAGDFTVTVDLSSTEIEANAFLNFTVTFEPLAGEDASDVREALLSIANNDSDEDPFEVNLTGTYQSPDAAGAVEETFDPNCNGTVYAAAMQPDGKLIIGGSFTVVDGSDRNYIARINDDGTVDATFDPDCDGEVLAIALEADGSIIIGGEFTDVGGTGRNYIARLNDDGTVAAFDPNADGRINCLALQANGKIIAGGAFANIGGGAKPWLARLATDGTLDGGFTSEVFGEVNGIVILGDGKLIVVGDWAPEETTTTTEATTTTTTEETTTTTTEETTTTTTEETTTTTTEETTTTTDETTTTTTTTEETTTTTTEEETTTTTTEEETTTTTTGE